jgi:hypothetical protein
MGLQIRGTVKEGDCHCLIFPHKKKGEQARLCFKKGILGAMSDEQEVKLCSPRSFIPKQDGGLAQDIRSENVQRLVQAMKNMSETSKSAHEKYQADVREDGERDMDRWRDTVKREAVKRTPLPREKPRRLTKAERLEIRKDPLEAAFDAALEKEERVLARKKGKKAPVEAEWDSASLGDYE